MPTMNMLAQSFCAESLSLSFICFWFIRVYSPKTNYSFVLPGGPALKQKTESDRVSKITICDSHTRNIFNSFDHFVFLHAQFFSLRDRFVFRYALGTRKPTPNKSINFPVKETKYEKQKCIRECIAQPLTFFIISFDSWYHAKQSQCIETLCLSKTTDEKETKPHAKKNNTFFAIDIGWLPKWKVRIAHSSHTAIVCVFIALLSGYASHRTNTGE